jgi:lysophospholipase L1-like esterase
MGGSGGSSAYNPCKASPCVILPLGDSITHGYNSTDDAGYRSALFTLIVAANQNVTFIGSLSNGPSTVSGKTFPKNHEGHDGITVTGITGWVPPAKAFTATPHIVLLHIGTNDMTSNADPSTTASQLDVLVGDLTKAAPDALIVVAKIVPLGYTSTTYNNYIAKIPGVVSAHTAKNEHVVMVDMSTLPTSDIRGSGNVHPTDKGYSDMATIWYDAIKGYLP